MKSTFAFVLFACFAVSALSLAEDAKKRSKPPATVVPAQAFSPSPGSTTIVNPNTTTISPNTTTVNPNTTTISPNTTTINPNTTTISPNTTTINPNTTTISPNTTTINPNTTTISPNTTTINPNTTTINPNTTTINPNTTTISPSTTTHAPPGPTPPTNLITGVYTLKNSENKVCLKAQVALEIRYVTPKVNGTFIVNPNETTAGGACQDTKANLTLTFKQGFITFMFNKNMSDNTVYVNALSFNFSYPFGGASGPWTANNQSVRLFPAKVGHSYSCKNESLYMGNDLYLDVNQDKMQAFNLTSEDFGNPEFCPADQPDYSVAIGVGVALLVLIVIVVVVYIVSRRKRTDGYQSL